MIENVTVTINNKKINVSKGTSLYEIAQQFQEEYDLPIILAKVNNQYKELSSPINKDASIELLTIKDIKGNLKEFKIELPKDEKDLKIEELERKVNEYEYKLSTIVEHSESNKEDGKPSKISDTRTTKNSKWV